MDENFASESLNNNFVAPSAEDDNFRLFWRHLNYTVYNSAPRRFVQRLQGLRNVPLEKQILREINGNIRSGELTAVMGPSGCGKTTLLECVVDKRVKGRTGDVMIAGNNLKNIGISVVAQKNNFATQFTVRETILFAAKLQIATKHAKGILENLYDEDGTQLQVNPASSKYCSIVTEKMIKMLGLESCADNRIRGCSGGELKRLAIAQELVAKPRILLLDEPTSGLDSTTSYQLLEVLKLLTQQKPEIAILATVHQPSFKLLKLFHKLYVISMNGDCIFEDSPENLVNKFNNQNLECPTNCNPADFIIQIAHGEHGSTVVENLVAEHRQFYEEQFDNPKNSVRLLTLKSNKSYPILKHICILFERNNLQIFRDPMVCWFRFVTTMIVPFFLTSVFGSQVGVKGGCPPKFGADFEPSQLNEVGQQIRNELESTLLNSGNIFFVALFVMFNALMPSLLSFPTEMIVFKSERANSWYGVPAFYFGKLASEIPQQFAFIALFWPVSHLMQNQVKDWWRFWTINVLLLLHAFITQAFACIVGSLCMYNVSASIFLGPSVLILPFTLLSCLFIKIKSASPLFQFLSYFSYIRFVVEALFVAIFGCGRCGEESKNSLVEGREAFIVWFAAMLGVYNDESTTSDSVGNITATLTSGAPSERFVNEVIDSIAGHFISDNNEVRSSVMNMFDLEDWFIQRAFIVLLIYLLVVRFIAYVVISIKVRITD